jgi:hypothetical protein
MQNIANASAILLVIGLSLSAHGQAVTSRPKAIAAPAPLYSISFERKEAVAGLDASPAIKLPFSCTADGTVFVTMVPVGGQMQPPLYAPPPLLLTSVSPSGHASIFPLDQVTEQLYDVREVDHYASESSVIFLVKAARENKPAKQTYTKQDGAQGEFTRNTADRYSYIVLFSRDGEYKNTIEADVSIEIQRIGAFPSGTFLAFGYDEKDHSPKLEMLKEDGTLMRTLQIGKDDAPESLFGTRDGSGKGPAAYITPAQLVPEGHSILVVQNKTSFPLLEVSEAGEIRAIHPKLPKDTQIEGLIASDLNLYARVNPKDEGTIYELSAHDGTVMRRFELGDGRTASGVACVHDGKFLSFEHGEGKLIPLIGTAEPVADVVDRSKQNTAGPTSSKSDKQ